MEKDIWEIINPPEEEEYEPTLADRIAIKNVNEAEGVMSRLRRLRKELQDVNDRAKEYVAEAQKKADQYVSKNAPRLTGQIELCEHLLQEYAKESLTGKKRSLKLVEGTLKFSKTRDKYEHDDAEILKYILEAGSDTLNENFVRKTPKLLWAELKKAGNVEDGKFYVNGELIRGVTVEQNLPDTFSVDLNE